jgi:rhodanese-related sulfurtransferase
MSRSPPEVSALTAVALDEWLRRGEPLTLLDVREADERAHCAIGVAPTARDLHVPMNDVPNRLDALRDAIGADPVVVYCHHGIRSMNVARWLVKQGFADVINLTGGIDAWSRTVDPTVRRY